MARLITFLLFVAVLLLFTCYSASIVVLLQSSSSSIRTLRDVLNSRLDLGAEATPYNKFFLEVGQRFSELVGPAPPISYI